MSTNPGKPQFIVAVLALLTCAFSFPVSEVDAARAQRASGRIAYGVVGRKPGLFVVGVSSGESRRLTKGMGPAYQEEFDPDWSPSGKRLLFAADPRGDAASGIFSISAGGSDLKRLSRAPCYADYAPDWSPDGKTILYRHDTCETARGYLMNPDGTDKRKITTIATFDPTWSPDGDWIAFSGKDGGRVQVFVMQPGKEPSPVTSSSETDPYGWENRDPSWAPSSDLLAYAGRINTRENGRNTAEVCTVKIDGTDNECLTEADGDDLDPEFAPSGERIVFVSHRDGKAEIYTMDPDGTEETRLTSSNGSNYNPSWSPDGDWIAFLSTRSGQTDIYVMRANGEGLKRLTRTGVREVDLAWAPAR